MMLTNNKGSILFLVIIFTFIIEFIAIDIFSMMQYDEIFAYQSVKQTRAFYVAEAGLERGVTWIKENNFERTEAFEPFGERIFDKGSSFLDQGKYRVSIVPDATNNGNLNKSYVIVSSGIIGNNDVITVVTSSITVNNLMQYVYFSDREYEGGVPPNYKDRIYFSGLDKFKGRVHSNDEISILQCPQFSIGSDNLYQVSTAKDYYYFSSKLRRSEKGNSFYLNLPESDYPIVQPINMFANWEESIDKLNSIAYVNREGGDGRDDCLYLEGNYDIELENNKAINYGSHGGGLTAFAINGSSSVVFVKGNVYVKNKKDDFFEGRLTIVSSGNIYIAGRIIYKQDALGNFLGCLGLVSTENVIVSKDVPLDEYCLNIDAFIMCNGCFYAEDWDTRFIPDIYDVNPIMGVIELNGMIINRFNENYRLGQAYATDVLVDTMISGYRKDYNFDDRILKFPPPYFPKVCSFKRNWWRE